MSEIIIPAQILVIREFDEIESQTKMKLLVSGLDTDLFYRLVRETRELGQTDLDPLAQCLLFRGVVVFPKDYTTVVTENLRSGTLVPCHAECLLEQIDKLIKETSGVPI